MARAILHLTWILTTVVLVTLLVTSYSRTRVYMNTDKITYKKKPRVLIPLVNEDLKRPGTAPVKDVIERIWNYMYKRQFDCTESMYLGGKRNGDGAYGICTENQFWPKTRDPSYKCLVYSFGIDFDFTFDDAIAKLGCEVHSFDPSMNYKDGFVRDSGVIFHKVGISDEDNDNGYRGWKMRTLKTIIKELGHTNRYLDALKVDTDKGGDEGFEDTAMKEILETGLYKCIRQYSMEVHLPSPHNSFHHLERYMTIYSQMRQLNDKGWRLFNTTDNDRYKPISQRQVKASLLKGGRDSVFWEVSFVNFDVERVCDM